jgi:hypothetical protein
MVANDRGTERCCCWIVVNLCVVVAGCVSLWLVLDRCGSSWGRCVSLYGVVGRCGVVVGSLWFFHVLVTTMYVLYMVMCVFV